MSDEYDEIEDPEMDEEIEDEGSDIEDEFEPSEFDEEAYEDIGEDFEPLDEKEINDELDQSDFEPFDPNDKQSLDDDKKNISDDHYTKTTETKEMEMKPLDKVSPDKPPKPGGNTIIKMPQQQQPKNQKPPQKPQKPNKDFWKKVDKGMTQFLKGFRDFFKKSDEEINKELLKKQYKKAVYEK